MSTPPPTKKIISQCHGLKSGKGNFMGLDMYLKAKTRLEKVGKKESTGACGGMFPLAPKMEDSMREIGYWRKAYSVQEMLKENIRTYNHTEKDNCVDFYITKEEVEEILKTAKAVLEENEFEDEYEKEEWKDTVEFFEIAKQILEEDEYASIFYSQWY